MTSSIETERKVHVIQGDCRVGSDSGLVLVTLLGSCVAACIRDPVAGVGGMNHFLLPPREPDRRFSAAESYGVHLMELLVNELMRHGAQRDRLEAKIFGGARMMCRLSDIGQENANFAKRFLKHEGIKIVASDLGGERGRRLQYWPVTGRARQSFISANQAVSSVPTSAQAVPDNGGSIELF